MYEPPFLNLWDVFKVLLGIFAVMSFFYYVVNKDSITGPVMSFSIIGGIIILVFAALVFARRG